MGRRKSVWMGLSLAALAAFAPNFVPGLYAEDASVPAAPAARAVRLSSVDGQVQLVVGNQAATAALANTPLFEGTQLTTADDGRAEIQFEDGSVARLSPNSSLTLTTLKMDGATPQTEILVNSGLAYVEFAGSGKMTIRFGDAIATPTGSAVLRVNLDTPPGTLAAFSGNVHLERGPTVMIDLHGGESVALNSGDATKYNLAESIEPDSWDGWNSDRDQALSAEAASSTGAASNLADNNGMAGPPPAEPGAGQSAGDEAPGDQAANDVGGADMAPNTPAWNDLDANGSWYNVPGTGYIWSPYAASGAGWDPYGCGRWQWTPQFGYIWVSCFNWGYLPYQFGAWNYYNGFGWGWAPGIGRRHPWWRGGVWISTVRSGPSGYRIPLRPHGLYGRTGGPLPAINVNRMAGAGTTGLPIRARNTPIAIGGQTVMPLRTITRRPQYSGPAPRGTTTRPQPRAGYVGGGATIWPAHSGPYGTSGPAIGSYVAPSSGTGTSAGGTIHGTVSSTPRATSAPRYTAPARPAPSGGGHVSSGGGGGGGRPAGGGTHR
jgi:hypothetical protein